MRRLPFLLAFVLTFASHVSSRGHHSSVVKSPGSLRDECRQYLGQQGQPHSCHECNYRCIGLVGRYWKDVTGEPISTIKRFYYTDPHDHGNYNRTEQCLGEVLPAIPLEDVCRRATCSVSCYDDQFGQLLVRRTQFIPFTDLKHQQVVEDCMRMLQIPAEQQRLMHENGVLSVPEGNRLLRCFLIREGVYSDSGGPNLNRLDVQCESCEDGVANVANCYASLQLQPLDVCTVASSVTEECYNAQIEIFPPCLGGNDETDVQCGPNEELSQVVIFLD